ncbi:trypsin-like serine protease [Elioraea sp.]|uniref:trypsin-like serine protease n=1 Tax=Elioraea sp. TaxID=2185103 RepID=UPI0025BD8E97|nr:trypsin-like serine protease [Elioraea sp.]
MIGAETIDEAALGLGMKPRYSGIGGVFASRGGAGNLCTGSLVSATMVLTAAHCFDRSADGTSDYAPSEVKFLYGNDLGLDLFRPTAPGIVASAIYLNPLYVADGTSVYQRYDLALLELSSAVPDAYQPFAVYASPGGNQADIVGYGKSGPGGSVQDNRKRAGVNAAYILDRSPNYTLVDFDQLGADDPGTRFRDGEVAFSKVEASPCGGDSGGPLLTMSDFMLSGVVTGSLRPDDEACRYGDVVAYVHTGQEDNAWFLRSHGVEVIDEPGTMALFGAALLALFAARRRGVPSA